MDSLDGSSWDVVIVGTGLKQSLLALSLSRSKLKVLHIDRNTYYGGNEAALNLVEAEAWAQRWKDDDGSAFARAVIRKHDEAKLGPPRTYSISLAPQLIYANSSVLSRLISSQLHGQLEFLAVGSWFVLERAGQSKLVKVPSGREDIFQDGSIDLKTKGALMKFVRFVRSAGSQELSADVLATPLSAYLSDKFGLPPTAHTAILALSMLPNRPLEVSVGDALPRVTRHLQSIGLYGPFPALMPKWGGLAEIAQVACRAGAVGGGTYVLDCGLEDVRQHKEDDDGLLNLQLLKHGMVKSKWLVGSEDNMPGQKAATKSRISRGIFLVSGTLGALFPPTAEGGVRPAGAVITAHDDLPIHILTHSSDSGECPSGQCVLYTSISESKATGFAKLTKAAQDLVASAGQGESSIIWSMQYEQCLATCEAESDAVIVLSGIKPSLVLEDDWIEEVRQAWKRLSGDEDDAFLKFDARDDADDE